MTDLGKLLIDRTHRVVTDGVGAVASPAGVGSVSAIDDAMSQFATIQAYFAVLAAGASPTSAQISAAISAMGALGADLRTIQSKPTPPSGERVWISAPAAGAAAVGSALVGGIVGYMVRGSKKEGSR